MLVDCFDLLASFFRALYCALGDFAVPPDHLTSHYYQSTHRHSNLIL